MLWQGCYRNPAQKGTFLSSYYGDILMEFRQPRKQKTGKNRAPKVSANGTGRRTAGQSGGG